MVTKIDIFCCPECGGDIEFDNVFECFWCPICGWTDLGDNGEDPVPALV